MRANLSVRIAAAILCSSLITAEASAQLMVAPPIVPKELDAAKGVVEEAIGRELAAANIIPLAIDEKTFNELGACKNKMSCLAQVAKPKGGSYVLHVILAHKDEEVLAQLTLLAVDKAKAIETVRGKSGLGLTLIEGAVTNAARQLVKTLKGLPAFKNDQGVASASLPSIPGLKDPGTPGTSAAKKDDKKPAPPPVRGTSEPVASNATASGGANGAATGGGAGIAPAPLSVGSKVESRRGPNYWAYTVGGVGLAAAIGGGVVMAMGASDLNTRNSTPQIEVDQRKTLLDSGQGKQTIGSALLIGGGVGLVVGVLMLATGWGASEHSAAMSAKSGSGPSAVFRF